MPLYEYHCQQCAKDVEILVLNQEQPSCPNCGTKKLQPKLSIVAAPGRSSTKTGNSTGGCGRPQCGMSGCQGLK